MKPFMDVCPVPCAVCGWCGCFGVALQPVEPCACGYGLLVPAEASGSAGGQELAGVGFSWPKSGAVHSCPFRAQHSPPRPPLQQQRKAPGHQQGRASGTACLSCVSCCQTILIFPLYLLRGCVTQKGPEAIWDRLQFGEGCAAVTLLAQHNWSLEVEDGEVWMSSALPSPAMRHQLPGLTEGDVGGVQLLSLNHLGRRQACPAPGISIFT